MSSPPEGKLETKAGHPPAVKAGGMRIVQKHPHSGDTKEEKDKDDQGWESPRSGLHHTALRGPGCRHDAQTSKPQMCLHRGKNPRLSSKSACCES
ncbi:death-associated protein 1 isoform X2 [Prionailurus bengalensis]|uniref:death-associated protein 1 isoform X2 n=1 Tax=Prionailurus bengalensis TaxID=37029 RepID=UPI001CA89DC1|nr:death-associated protein 1 isoform X2 [Prionailurus bengalensis]